jgi:uncharacterized protein (TIGR02996 family)
VGRKRPASPPASSELLGLLRACKDAPEDDAPLLVLADWLEERDGPTDADRAELIRVQCRLAHADASNQNELRATEGRLIGQHRKAWVGPLHSSATFKRGLLHLSPTVTKFFSRDVSAWLDAETGAWATSLQLQQFSGRNTKRLAGRSCLTHLSRLGFLFGGKEAVDLGELLASPHLVNLRELDLVHLTIGDGDAAAEAIAAWPGLAGLVCLSLCGIGMTDRGASVLAASPALRGMRTLGLHYNNLTDAAAVAVASSPHLTNLRELWLTGTSIGEAGVLALVNSPHLTGLQKLTFTKTSLSPSALETLRQRFPELYSGDK